MNYGLPYQGSKNAIAKDICGMLPLAENFYDLFAGGGSAVAYAWFVWQKGFRGVTEVLWI